MVLINDRVMELPCKWASLECIEVVERGIFDGGGGGMNFSGASQK